VANISVTLQHSNEVSTASGVSQFSESCRSVGTVMARGKVSCPDKCREQGLSPPISKCDAFGQSLTRDLPRIFVIPKRDKSRVTEVTSWRPFRILNCCNEFRL
jgi:hypothetical protein